MKYLTFGMAPVAALLLVSSPGDLDVISLNGRDCGLEGKPGGSAGQKELNRLKNRYDVPGESDIDGDISLPALLAPGKDFKRFDPRKAARISGLVIDVKMGGVESCNCEATDPNERDTHIELSLAEDAPETQRVIVEVTPRLRLLMKKKDLDWTTSTLRDKLKGKWVEVIGWLLFDVPHIRGAENTNPGGADNWRATCWELHPVTSITVLDGPPAEAAEFRSASLAAMHRLHAANLARVANGKTTLQQLQKEYLSKFSDEELKEAEAEAKARHPRP